MLVELISANAPAERIALQRLPAMIGRDDGAEVHLDDSWVGRCQCIVDREGDELRVLDLGSRTGTFVNGRRVSRSPLLPGDRLLVGRTEFVVQYTQAAIAAPRG